MAFQWATVVSFKISETCDYETREKEVSREGDTDEEGAEGVN